MSRCGQDSCNIVVLQSAGTGLKSRHVFKNKLLPKLKTNPATYDMKTPIETPGCGRAAHEEEKETTKTDRRIVTSRVSHLYEKSKRSGRTMGATRVQMYMMWQNHALIILTQLAP